MKEREVVNAPFFKFTRVGMAAAGRVTRYDTNKNSDFVVLEPCFVKRDAGEKVTWVKYPAACIGLTTDLARKITREDKGKALMMQFTDTKPSDSGSDQKLFKVYELEKEEVSKLTEQSTEAPEGENVNGPGTSGGSGKPKDDDEDLPW